MMKPHPARTAPSKKCHKMEIARGSGSPRGSQSALRTFSYGRTCEKSDELRSQIEHSGGG